VGFAYRLNDKTVVRGGFGMSNIYRYTTSWQYPVKQTNQLLAANSFVAAGSMAAGFPTPQPIVIPSNGVISPAPNSNFGVTPPDSLIPTIETWNLAVQRQLPKNMAIEATYVGNHAYHISNSNVINNSFNLNAAMVAGTGNASEPYNILYGRTANTTYPAYEGSHYDALQAKLSRRFANGFSMQASYAFGKNIDYSAYNMLGFVNMKGLSKYDRRHIFTYSGSWELPFGKGKAMANHGVAAALAGGWQLNGVWTWQSGLPLNFSASSTNLNAPGNTVWPQQVAPVQILGLKGSNGYWFTPSSFVNPTGSNLGNVGRNILNGPRLFNISGSVFRRFNITERVKLEFRAEAFNATNTPLFDSPDTTLGDANFGRITTAHGNQAVQSNPNRLLQGSLRLSF
jgi:hypothetical protein